MEEIGKITARPNTVRAFYEAGKTITPTSVIFEDFQVFLNQGYTYDVVFDTVLDIPGMISSDIQSLVIYDPLGNDVTAAFDITLKQGTLQLYLYEVELETAGAQKVYDGFPISNETYYLSGLTDYNHNVGEITYYASQTNVGSTKNRATIKIYDQYGTDVTELYKINTSYGDLVIMPRIVHVESNDATKAFDGTALIDHFYSITSGGLAANDSIQVIITGSQTGIGTSVNTIESVVITRDGIDMTYNYIIELIEGELSVTPNFN